MKIKQFLSSGIVGELIRFVIIGLYGTLIDYVVEVWATSLVAPWQASVAGNHILSYLVLFVISVIGFLVSTPASWSLTSVWGFQNVRKDDEAKAKSFKGTLRFAMWSFFALLGGSIIQFLGYMICLEWSPLGINILNISFTTLFGADIATFWAYSIIFVLRTMFTMVFNYLTRKFILYRAPKEEK